MNEETSQKLLDALREKAYRKGDFTLASGQKSDYYIDCKEVTLDAVGALLVGQMIYETIARWDIVAVGGMELGSVPISTAVSMVSAIEGAPLANFIVRKDAKGHGTGKKIEGAIKAGDRVVVVEDVVSTGGSSLKAIEVLREAGIEVAGIVTIVDREMGGRATFDKASVPFEPLFTITEIKSVS